MGRPSAKVTITAAASTLLVAAVYVLRLDRAAGIVVDDAWYVLLGRSLARGEGFALTSSAAAAILPSVPPGFPAVLAAVFRFAPSFPGNLAMLKAVSIAAMLAAGACTYGYARSRALPPAIAWLIAMVVALTPGLVFLATSTVMAECLFTLLQLAAVIAIDRAADARAESQPARALPAAALVVAAWLVRSAGITLAAAALIHLARRARPIAVAIFASASIALAAPWLIYSRAHAPSATDRDRNGGSIAVAYSDAILLRVAGTTSSGRVSGSELPLRAARNLVNIFGRDAGGLLTPVLYRGASESGEEVFSLGALGFLAGSMGNSAATIVWSLVLALVVAIGYAACVRERATVAELLVPITLAMLLVYPYWTYRFVLPLAPFVLVYFARGVREVGARVVSGGSADPWRAARIALLCVVILHLADHAQYIRALRDPARAPAIDWLADSDGVDAALAWMESHLVEPGSVASTNPALVFLRTGRKGVTFDGSALRLEDWRAMGVRYIASLRAGDVPAALASQPILYRDAARRLWIVGI